MFATTRYLKPRTRRFLQIRQMHATYARRERQPFDPNAVERPEDEVDVCIVGAGPAGLSAAIRLKQLEQEKGRETRVIESLRNGDHGVSQVVKKVNMERYWYTTLASRYVVLKVLVHARTVLVYALEKRSV